MTSFNRVATDGLQASIHGLRQQNPTWEVFEESLKTTFTIEDSSKAMRRGFEDWVETADKGMKVLDVFSAFESRFGRLSVRDQAILVPDKVIMFLRADSEQKRKEVWGDPTLRKSVDIGHAFTDETRKKLRISRKWFPFTKRRRSVSHQGR